MAEELDIMPSKSGHTESDHFVDITEMVGIGSGLRGP